MKKNETTGFLMLLIMSLLLVIVYPGSGVYGAELTKPEKIITMDLDDYRQEDIYEYDYDDLYEDLYGNLDGGSSVTTKTGSSNSRYSHSGSSYMGSTNEDFSLPGFYNLLDEILREFDTPLTKLIFFIAFLLGILWCFCGYRVYHVFTGITAFILINLGGLIATAAKDSAGYFILGIIISTLVLIFCIKYKSFAAFLMGSVNSLPLFMLIFLCIAKDSVASMIILPAICSIILGVVTAYFKKPLIIITSAVEWGPFAGISLGCLIHHTNFGTWLGLIFIVAGILYQCYYHGGLLESGPVLIKSFGKNKDGKASETEKLSDVSFSEPPAFKKKSVPDYTAAKGSEKTAITTKEPSSEATSAKADTVYCSKCGAKQKKGSAYCTACGAAIADKRGKPASVSSPVSSDSAAKPEAAAPVYEKPASVKPVEKMPADHTVAPATDDSKLKFGSFSRVPDPSPEPEKPGELKISLGESRPEPNRIPDPNSRMKPADDFDD